MHTYAISKVFNKNEWCEKKLLPPEMMRLLVRWKELDTTPVIFLTALVVAYERRKKN